MAHLDAPFSARHRGQHRQIDNAFPESARTGARGKRTYVNFNIRRERARIHREPEAHLADSPPWCLEVRDSGDYTDGRADWDEMRRTLLLQLMPNDIDAILRLLVNEGLIELRGLRATASLNANG